MSRRRAIGLLDLNDEALVSLAAALAAKIRGVIVDGVWVHGDKLPSTRRIATDVGVSRNTVVAALETLVAEGILISRGRSGLYVNWRRRRPKPSAGVVKSEPPRVVDANRPLSWRALPLNLFPMKEWRRLETRRWNITPLSLLEGMPCAGFQRLRNTIADYVQISRGLAVDWRQVFIVTDLRRALDLTIRAREERGPIFFDEPGQPGLTNIIQSIGCIGVPIPVDKQGIRIDGANLATPQPGLVIVRPHGQFPLGVRLSRERAAQIIAWAESRRGNLVFEDGVESEFQFQGPKPQALAASAPDKVVYFNSFSRTLYPGLGIAYLIAPPSLVEDFQRAMCAVSEPVTSVDQAVLADFIDSGQFDKHVRASRSTYAGRRSCLIQALKTEFNEAVQLEDHAGGLHAFAGIQTTLAAQDCVEKARAKGVEIQAVAHPADGLTAGIVLGFAAFEDSAIKSAITLLGQALAFL